MTRYLHDEADDVLRELRALQSRCQNLRTRDGRAITVPRQKLAEAAGALHDAMNALIPHAIRSEDVPKPFDMEDE